MLSKLPLPKNQAQWQLLFGIYILFIAVLSLTPTETRDLPVQHLDKIGHFLAYAGMGILAMISFKRRNSRLFVILLTLIIAYLLEWGQTFVPGRVASLTDGLTNYLGLLAGMGFYWVYLRCTGNAIFS